MIRAIARAIRYARDAIRTEKAWRRIVSSMRDHVAVQDTSREESIRTLAALRPDGELADLEGPGFIYENAEEVETDLHETEEPGATPWEFVAIRSGVTWRVRRIAVAIWEPVE